MPEIPKHLADWLEKQDERCNYCIYDSRCTIRGVHGGPNGPIYPFCCDAEPEKYIDLAALEEAYEEVLAWHRDNKEFFRLSCMAGAARAAVRNAKTPEELAEAQTRLARLEEKLVVVKREKEDRDND